MVTVPAEQYRELPPWVDAFPLDFSKGFSAEYIASLRRLNSLAMSLNFAGIRTARLFHSFPADDPKAFKISIKSRYERGAKRHSTAYNNPLTTRPSSPLAHTKQWRRRWLGLEAF